MSCRTLRAKVEVIVLAEDLNIVVKDLKVGPCTNEGLNTKLVLKTSHSNNGLTTITDNQGQMNYNTPKADCPPAIHLEFSTNAHD